MDLPMHINNWTTKNAFFSEQCFVKTICVNIHNSANGTHDHGVLATILLSKDRAIQRYQ